MTYEICETTGKRCYDKVSANTEVNTAIKKHWKTRAKKIPTRVYFCTHCNHYHLTSEVRRDEGRGRIKRREKRQSDERRRIERMETVIRRYTREYR